MVRHRAVGTLCVYGVCASPSTSTSPTSTSTSTSTFTSTFTFTSMFTSTSTTYTFLGGGQPPTLAASRRTLERCAPPPGVPGVYFRLSCFVLALLFAILAPRCHNIAQDNPKDTILEPTSSKIAPKGPSRRAPDPRKTTKSVVVLVVFTLRLFLLRSRSRSEI